MKTYSESSEYLYSFANVSITLRIIEYLNDSQLPVDSVAVINAIDRWVVKVDLKYALKSKQYEDVRAFFNEMGIPYQPSSKVAIALQRLAAGEAPTEVMNRYQVVIVAHGEPTTEEIEIFRTEIVDRLGYCPQTMA